MIEVITLPIILGLSSDELNCLVWGLAAVIIVIIKIKNKTL